MFFYHSECENLLYCKVVSDKYSSGENLPYLWTKGDGSGKKSRAKGLFVRVWCYP
jgi:hypothetical protein